MLAISIDNLLFILLIAAAALFQLLSKAVAKTNKNKPKETPTPARPPTTPPIRRAPADSDADRVRKFLEALGQPPSSAPPPPIVPRTAVPPRPLAPVQPPPVVIPGEFRLPREQQKKPEITRREKTPIEQPHRVQEVIPPLVPSPAASAFEVREHLPFELQRPPSISEASVEAYAAPNPVRVAKGTVFKTDIATLVASESGLREAIILREIFGPPRGLWTTDLL